MRYGRAELRLSEVLDPQGPTLLLNLDKRQGSSSLRPHVNGCGGGMVLRSVDVCLMVSKEAQKMVKVRRVAYVQARAVATMLSCFSKTSSFVEQARRPCCWSKFEALIYQEHRS